MKSMRDITPPSTRRALARAMLKTIASLVVKDNGEYSRIHVFAFVLVALHVTALFVWIFLTARQRPPSARDRVDPTKDE